MTRGLVEQLAQEKVDVVIGIARGGLIPATAIAAALRCEMFPIRLTRRMHDEGCSFKPRSFCWMSPFRLPTANALS
jgi:adenine/guanine phosphoribosyltransferase-like PRPP-binding protein